MKMPYVDKYVDWKADKGMTTKNLSSSISGDTLHHQLQSDPTLEHIGGN